MNTKTVILASILVGVVAFTGYSATDAAVNLGNGKKSKNLAKENKVNLKNVAQFNAAGQQNVVGVAQDAGNNKANSNTNGDVDVSTGEAGVAVLVENLANENASNVDSCGCEGDSGTALNSGNGVKSNNTAIVKNKKVLNVGQSNVATQTNVISVSQSSGNNKANGNTGGDVNVETGNVSAEVGVYNAANSNTLVVE